MGVDAIAVQESDRTAHREDVKTTIGGDCDS